MSFHVAIIPDGNRRWAVQRDLAPMRGHEAGRKALDALMPKVEELDITHLTFWGASVDNLTKRPREEVVFLDTAFHDEFQRLIANQSIHEQEIHVTIVGEWERFLTPTTVAKAKEAMQATEHYSRRFLTVLVAYDGVHEMQRAISALVQRGRVDPTLTITPEVICEELATGQLPPVDLLIRTGTDPHNSSGFMMWHTAYSQYIFSPLLWPDFTPEALTAAVEEFHRRGRRFGA